MENKDANIMTLDS